MTFRLSINDPSALFVHGRLYAVHVSHCVVNIPQAKITTYLQLLLMLVFSSPRVPRTLLNPLIISIAEDTFDKHHLCHASYLQREALKNIPFKVKKTWVLSFHVMAHD